MADLVEYVNMIHKKNGSSSKNDIINKIKKEFLSRQYLSDFSDSDKYSGFGGKVLLYIDAIKYAEENLNDYSDKQWINDYYSLSNNEKRKLPENFLADKNTMELAYIIDNY